MAVGTKTTAVFPNNTRGTMKLADQSATVDNVFIFYEDDNNTKPKYERIVDGAYSIRWAKVLANGTSQTSKIQAALSHARVTTMVLDMDGGGTVTCNGTLNCGGKYLMWMPGTKLSTSSTLVIDNAIIVGYAKEQLFASTNITLTNCKVGTDRFSSCWYTGVASGLDQQPQFQKSTDTCILNNIKNVYTPAFVQPYVLSKGVLLSKDANGDGNLEFFTLNWEGERRCYGNSGDTTLTLQNGVTDSFVIGWQRAKGLRIANMSIQGTNTNIQNLGSTRKWCEDQSFNWINGFRNNSSSPYAGLVGDIGSSGVAVGNRYPTHLSAYTDPSGGGSTDVVIEGMDIRHFVVNIALNPAGLPQNGDLTRIYDCWIQYCYSGIATGESQNRSCICRNIWCWGGVETLFDSRRYGDGTSNPPEVDCVNIAGGVRYLTRMCGFGNSHGQSIRAMHGELLYSLGGNFDGNDLGDLFISDTWIQFTGNVQADGDGTTTHHPKTMFRGGKLTVSGNSILSYYGGGSVPMSFCGLNVKFDTTAFDYLPFNNRTNGQINFSNCTSGEYWFGEDQTVDYRAENSPNSHPFFISGMKFNSQNSTRNTYNSFVKHKINKITGSSGFGIKNADFIFVGNLAVTNIWDPDLGAGGLPGYSHCDITLNIASTEFKMLQIGDYLLTQSTDEFGRANAVHGFGTIAAKNGGTGVITIKDIFLGVTAISYNFFLYRAQQFLPVFATGNCISGNNVISGIKIELSASQLPTIPIFSPYFPEGTMLLSYDGAGNATMSNPATATATNIDIISSDWKAIVHSYQPDPAQVDKIGWKKGDEIYNDRSDLFNTVLKWVCVKSGISNEAGRKPQFVAVEWFPDEFDPSADTSRIVEGYFTLNIKAKTDVDVPAFKIGSTFGGSEIFAATAINFADGWVDIIINFFDPTITTLYFGGITQQMHIKIEKIKPALIT